MDGGDGSHRRRAELPTAQAAADSSSSDLQPRSSLPQAYDSHLGQYTASSSSLTGQFEHYTGHDVRQGSFGGAHTHTTAPHAPTMPDSLFTTSDFGTPIASTSPLFNLPLTDVHQQQSSTIPQPLYSAAAFVPNFDEPSVPAHSSSVSHPHYQHDAGLPYLTLDQLYPPVDARHGSVDYALPPAQHPAQHPGPPSSHSSLSSPQDYVRSPDHRLGSEPIPQERHQWQSTEPDYGQLSVLPGFASSLHVDWDPEGRHLPGQSDTSSGLPSTSSVAESSTSSSKTQREYARSMHVEAAHVSSVPFANSRRQLLTPSGKLSTGSTRGRRPSLGERPKRVHSAANASPFHPRRTACDFCYSRKLRCRVELDEATGKLSCRQCLRRNYECVLPKLSSSPSTSESAPTAPTSRRTSKASGASLDGDESSLSLTSASTESDAHNMRPGDLVPLTISRKDSRASTTSSSSFARSVESDTISDALSSRHSAADLTQRLPSGVDSGPPSADWDDDMQRVEQMSLQQDDTHLSEHRPYF